MDLFATVDFGGMDTHAVQKCTNSLSFIAKINFMLRFLLNI